MPDIVEIPKRALFKSSEVCEIAAVQPYVLRSWESEFPDLGVSKGNGAPRVYRRADVERVLRIKQLVFSDGLTLAGVRRRFEDERPARIEEADVEPVPAPAPPPLQKDALGRHARARIAEVKSGLRAILDMLSTRPSPAQVVQFSRPGPRAVARPKASPKRVKAAARAARKTGRSRR